MRRIRTEALGAKRAIDPALPERMAEWLGKDGIEFFYHCLVLYGNISPVYSGGVAGGVKIPHAVHFQEGMQVRNFMRDTKLCLGWSAIDYDDRWEEVVHEALSWWKNGGRPLQSGKYTLFRTDTGWDMKSGGGMVSITSKEDHFELCGPAEKEKRLVYGEEVGRAVNRAWELLGKS